MTLAAERWPTFAGGAPETGSRSRTGVAIVWGLELAKLTGQIRVRTTAAICVVAPFLVAAAVSVQNSVPNDTLFGQWLHESGFALPMVVLGFAGQWLLPLLTSIVSGDIFSAEDHFGTWKTVLSRSRSRGELYAGKTLAAATYTVMMLVVLAASTLLAGLLLGTQPVVGLSGQLVPAGHAAALVAVSWATQIPPLLGVCSLAIALSVVTHNSPIGMGGPVVISLVMQLSSLVDLPSTVRDGLLSTPFAAWHGLWVQGPFYGPVLRGLVTSGVWLVISVSLSWIVFRRRSFAAS